MQATLIIPLDEGTADLDGVISGGIRVIAGKLTPEQLEALIVEPAYKRRAIQRRLTQQGEFVGLYVTFHNEDVEPVPAMQDSDGYRYEGALYCDLTPGRGRLAYETRYVNLENPPASPDTVCMYVLTSCWEEPCEGNSVQSCCLTNAEAEQVQAAIDWLEEHAGDEWGGTLASWELVAEPGLTGDADLDGLNAVLDELSLNSRYDEDPTYYGDERYPPFEARNEAGNASAD